MADHAALATSTNYIDLLNLLHNRLADGALAYDPAHTTATNLPTHTLRFNSAAARWEKWNGSAWAVPVAAYAISVTGNAATATTLATARTINGVSFNGSANITLNASTPTSLTFNNGGAGAASGSTFDGSAARTISWNTIGAPSATGAGASGTWGISITGGAASAGSAGTLTGSADSAVTGTTQAAKTSDTRLATTAFVDRLRSLLAGVASGTLTIADRGCGCSATGNITVPASVFAQNDVVTINNTTGSPISIIQGSGLTMRLAGTATTGTRTLAGYGVATILFDSASACKVSGAGVS